MRALNYREYGDLTRLSLGELPEPKQSDGPLVAVEVAALNPKDALFRKGKFKLLSGRKFPKQCGLDFAGTVTRAGGGLREGDRVFGALNEWTFRRGTLAEFVAPRSDEVALLPSGVDAAHAASVALVGLTALQALRDVARVQRGASVLINGASGGVGTVAIQLARLLGAEVTTISSAATTELCRSLGATHTLDYAAVETQRRYDVLFDVFGNLKFEAERRRLNPKGVFISTVPSAGRLVRDVVTRFSPQQERLVVVKPKRTDLDQLGAWLQSGELRAVIDGRYALEDFAQAFTKLESKHTHGKLLISLSLRSGERAG
ncbi:MAG: NAD(P)-dependent alcohol dehydrogenase [Archangium sp.]